MRKKYMRFILSISIIFSLIMFTSCSIMRNNLLSNTETKNIRDFTFEVVEDDITYDGTEKQVTIALYEDGKLVDTISKDNAHPDLEVSYNNNVNAGEASAYICAKEDSTKYIGGINVSFVISPIPSTIVDDVNLLKQYSSSGNYLEVKLGCDLTVPENLSITVNEKTTLNLNGKNLHIEGLLNVFGCIKFEKDSSLYLHGDTQIKGGINSIAINGPNATIYSDSTLTLPATYEGLNIYQRTKLNASLLQYNYDYNEQEITPTVIANCDESEYDVKYENNKNVGEATVIVTAKTDSKYVFGTSSINFSITTINKIANNDAMLAEIMQDQNYTNILLDGNFSDVTIPEGYNVTTNDVTISGDLIVNGKFTLNSDKKISVSGNTIINGTFINNGYTTIENIQNNGEISNNKTITINGQFINNKILLNNSFSNLYCNSDYRNGENSSVNNLGLIYFENSYESVGEMTNKGDIYFFAKENITSTNKIKNDGCIYSDISLINIIDNSYKGKSIVRREISSDFVSLYKSKFYYDAKAKNPTLKFVSGSNNLTVNSDDYYLTKRYTNSETNSYTTINPGIVNVTIEFKKESKSYTGTIVLQYEILRGIYTITNDSDFDIAFADENYATALIDEKIITTKDLNIPYYSELKISENGGLVYTGTMQVSGVVNNDGNLTFAKTGSFQININEDGKINNSGSIFFNDFAQDGVISGEGKIYVRTKIQDSFITDFPEKVPFDTIKSTGVCPDFKVIMNEMELILHDDFIAEYSNNKTINTNALVTVKANDFSQNIYGSVIISFVIERGTITVHSYDDMKHALITKTGDVCNFTTINLGCNLVKIIGSITSTQIETLVIPKDTVLDCGQYILDLRIKDGYKGKYKIENSGTIKVKKPFTYTDYNYRKIDDGEVIGETNNLSDLVGLSKICSKIYITDNVSYHPAVHIINPKLCNLEIELNGYTLPYISIQCGLNALTIKSTNKPGKISSVKIISTGANITFENLMISSIDDNGFSYLIFYKNCTFS